MMNYNGRQHQNSWPRWRIIFTGLNVLALVLSGILSWHYLAGGAMVGCSGGSSCDSVLNSRWSDLAGIIPVSGLAMGAYMAIFAAGFFIGRDNEISLRRLAWSAIIILSGAIAGSALWFTIVQKWIIGEFCVYCMTTHVTGFSLAVLAISRVFKENNFPNEGRSEREIRLSDESKYVLRPLHVAGLVVGGLLLAGTMASFQVKFAPSSIYSDGESHANLPAVDYKSVPMIGSPDAPYIVNLLFDYQCPHCQKIHFMLNEIVRRYNGNIAFVLCPTPLNTECNPFVSRDTDAFRNSCELAQIGLAVWRADREAFPDFEKWMFTFEAGDRWQPRSLEAARTKAIGLVGKQNFDKALSDQWIGQYIQTCIRIYGQTVMNGQGGVPKLVYGSRWVIPEPSSVEDFISILQNSLGVPNPY